MTGKANGQYPTPPKGRQRLSVLGSTGSIGCSTLDLVDHCRQSDQGIPDFDLVALSAHKNVGRLIEQARHHKPEVAVIADPGAYGALKEGLAGSGVEPAAGQAALLEAASREADCVVAGIVGTAGLAPTLQAIAPGARLGLANKECLVTAGALFLKRISDQEATLIPVDSEHSAIFQVFDFDRPETVEALILTASGGPFRSLSQEAMAGMTAKDALQHPTWSMGAKISIDSATMMNKGLEMIEAFHLFPVTANQIDVVVHPQSIVHSFVRYVDGSVLAQLGSPDMRTPIALAMSWPDRMPTPAAPLDFSEAMKLTFEPPDMKRFPALRLAQDALALGGHAPAILNAANEVAVAAFLDGRIGFLDICAAAEDILEEVSGAGWTEADPHDLETIFAVDCEARRRAENWVVTHAV
ncbi:MAG: 1-deoxy-D-xylulose-5-phosphate reductoisomerase [Pseudomonadota bacterium]